MFWRQCVLRLSLYIDGETISSSGNFLSKYPLRFFSRFFPRISRNNNCNFLLLTKRLNIVEMTRIASTSSSDGILKSEFPPVPIQTEHFSKTFLGAIWSYFSENPHRPALINAHDESDHITFGELYVYCHSVAAFLKQQVGFGSRDIACIVTPNCWEYMAIFGGVILRGGALSGASHMFTSFELKGQFDDCRCTVIFTSESCLQQVLDATKTSSNVKNIIVIPERRNSSSLSETKSLSHFNDNRIVDFTDVIRFDPIVEHQTSADFRADKEIIILPYSSGTTGTPKGVMISHKNLGSIMNMYSWQFNNKILPYIDSNYNYLAETQLHILPFYHIFGFATVVNHLLNGSTVVVMKAFDPNLLCHHLEKYKCRFFLLVPPIMIFLAKSPIVSRYDLSNLQLVLSGAAPAGRELCEELQRRLPTLKAVAQGYGMTELSISSHIPICDGKDRYEKAGKLLPNMELKIVDETGEVITDKHTPGELFLRGPNVMMGYWERPSANAETLDSDGWLRTGDIAYVDEEGFLCVVDRLKELIKVRGLQVAPAELEDILLSMPQVQDCAVIGVPDEHSGELPMAFIVRTDKTLQADHVNDYVNEKVAHYKQLKGGIKFVEEIPKSASGKILRRVLRDKYLKLTSKL